MSSYLWKATANKNFGKVLKGIMVEVLVTNRSGKPLVIEIQEAFERKYPIKVGGGMPESTFDIVKG
jgi:hypothetical protein